MSGWMGEREASTGENTLQSFAFRFSCPTPAYVDRRSIQKVLRTFGVNDENECLRREISKRCEQSLRTTQLYAPVVRSSLELCFCDYIKRDGIGKLTAGFHEVTLEHFRDRQLHIQHLAKHLA